MGIGKTGEQKKREENEESGSGESERTLLVGARHGVVREEQKGKGKGKGRRRGEENKDQGREKTRLGCEKR